MFADKSQFCCRDGYLICAPGSSGGTSVRDMTGLVLRLEIRCCSLGVGQNNMPERKKKYWYAAMRDLGRTWWRAVVLADPAALTWLSYIPVVRTAMPSARAATDHPAMQHEEAQPEGVENVIGTEVNILLCIHTSKLGHGTYNAYSSIQTCPRRRDGRRDAAPSQEQRVDASRQTGAPR